MTPIFSFQELSIFYRLHYTVLGFQTFKLYYWLPTVYALVNRHSNVLRLQLSTQDKEKYVLLRCGRRCESFPLWSRIIADANLLTRKRRNRRDWLICALKDEMQASGRCSASGERLFVTDTTREPHEHKDADRHSSLASGSELRARRSWVTRHSRLF